MNSGLVGHVRGRFVGVCAVVDHDGLYDRSNGDCRQWIGSLIKIAAGSSPAWEICLPCPIFSASQLVHRQPLVIISRFVKIQDLGIDIDRPPLLILEIDRHPIAKHLVKMVVIDSQVRAAISTVSSMIFVVVDLSGCYSSNSLSSRQVAGLFAIYWRMASRDRSLRMMCS